MFSSNKKRFYVCLYLRGGSSKMPGKEDTYHWALVVGPKQENAESKGKRYHAKENTSNPPTIFWEFTREDTGTSRTNALLVRIMIGKVKSLDVLDSILGSIPIRAGDPNYPGWNCVAWVKEALETINAHQDRDKALGTAVLDWQTVRDSVMNYIDKKRGQGRWSAEARSTFNMEAVPTFNLLENEEAIA